MSSDEALLQADAAARRAALDVARSFIVQAPAGSGKTELLIQRYLRLLAIVDDPEEVLAITFTRKAAAEMRERVVAALERAESGEVPEAAHEVITYDAATTALARDRERGWELVNASRRMRIQTLDSLCAGIARLLPVTSGLGATGSIVQDAAARQLYRTAALATLDWLVDDEAAGDAVELVLSHLDNNTAVYLDYLSRMLESRDQWLQITGPGEPGDTDAIRRRLEHNIADIVEHRLAQVKRRLEALMPRDMPALIRYAAGNLAAAGSDDAGLEALDGLPGTDAGSLSAWQALVNLLLATTGSWRKTVDRRQGFPPGDDGQKENWKHVLETLARDRDLAGVLDDVRKLPPARYSDQQWQVLLALLRVLPLAVMELRQVFQEQGTCDHVEVAMAAGVALGSAERPGDLAMMLDYRIGHMLVDEMQDTSISQYAMLETLTAGWSPGDGRTFFCVGDPMQSIYRFRNAEVGQFVRARAHGLGSLPLEPLTLRRNFRSGEHLVHWFNTVFAAVFPADDEPSSGAVSYSESVPVESLRGIGEYSIDPLFDAEVGDEAKFTAEMVERRLGQGGDVAVLVRSRTQLPELLRELRRHGIAYEAVEIDRLTDLPEIIDLLALARAISHLDDRAAWLALLRGPLVGLSWTDLHRLVYGARGESVWSLVRDPGRRATLTAEGRRLVERFLPEADAFMADDRVRSLRERLECAWYRLGGPACLDDAEQMANASRFLDIIDKISAAGVLKDPAVIQSHLEEERVSSPAGDDCRVHVMTMHKAKGLQFDHVILPSLGRYTSGGDRAVLNWLNIPAEDGGSDLVLSPVGASYELEGDPLHGYIEAARKASDRLEQDRLLYVACTRARRSLTLVGNIALAEGGDELRPPDARTLFSRLWPAIEREVNAAFDDREPTAREPDDGNGDTVLAEPVLRRMASGWTPPRPPSPPEGRSPDAAVDDEAYEVQFDWVGAAARDAGTLVHRWLQRFADGDIPTIAELDDTEPMTRSWARQMGVTADNLPAVLQRVRAGLEGLLADDRGRWILEGDGHAELPLTGLWHGHIVSVVLDRVRIDGGTHWIVDYKTSTHEGGDLDGFLQQEAARYARQLDRYRALYRAWSEAGDIRTALYFPLIGAFREIAPGQAHPAGD